MELNLKEVDANMFDKVRSSKLLISCNLLLVVSSDSLFGFVYFLTINIDFQP